MTVQKRLAAYPKSTFYTGRGEVVYGKIFFLENR